MSHRSKSKRSSGCRRLGFESLESRQLMAVGAGFLHNVDEPLDVNGDQSVSPVDALAVINFINNQGSMPASGEGESTYFLDVNEDQSVSPLDALMVINQLNLISPPAPIVGQLASANAPGKVHDSIDADADVITETEVDQILQRGSMATTSEDAIIAVVDRSGRILGVRVEKGVEDMYAGRDAELAFAIDGAVAKARTAAFFGNNQAPLTSRTIRNISQSTITQREVESSPNVSDINSPLRGPGWVAPIGIGGHFPPEIANTPQVDLFAIEHQNRDSAIAPGFDGIKGTVDDVKLNSRFDVDLNFVPSGAMDFMTTFPESYGYQSGLFPNNQSRGFATLPGGIPLSKNLKIVGGVGVFFPGEHGYASYEQGFVPASQRGALGPQTELERTNASRVLESEFIAYFASSGTRDFPGGGPIAPVPVYKFEGAAPWMPAYGNVIGRIDLVGITLEIFGPNPTRANPVTGPNRLIQVGDALGGGHGANSGHNKVIAGANTANPKFHLKGSSVPEGWLVLPHDSLVDPIKAADVARIIQQGVDDANLVRAAIRLDTNNHLRPGARTKMVLAVTDSTGEVLGLFRMPDATIFSIDVAVAKARNTSYFAGASLASADQVDFNNDGVSDLPAGTAISNRTIRFLAEPRYPTGAAVNTPGDFSILNDPGININTAENVGPALPASVYASKTSSVLAFDAFNASRNFRDPRNLKKQNGIVFFPGSTPLYTPGTTHLIGGFGVSGDGVDQDDVVTASGQVGFEAPAAIRADQYIVNAVRLPFQKFNRNPLG